MLEKRPLPNSQASFSPLTLGTVKFGRNQSVKYPSGFELPSDIELQALLSLCLELGITSLDTAPAYGLAEERLGKLLLGQRHKFQIISKAGEQYDSQNDSSYYQFDAASLNKQLDNSLKLLNTDYLDCWMLHSDGQDCKNLSDEVIHCLQQAKQAGKVLSTGLSGKTLSGGKKALAELDTIMMTASLSYHDEDALFGYAEEAGKAVFLKKIFNSGWLLKPSSSNNPTPTTEKNTLVSDTFDYLFAQQAVCSAVIGTINPKHLKENAIACMQALSKL